MRSFEEIFHIAATRKGGVAELEAPLSPPIPRENLATISDDRWLAQATKCIFQAGFNWKVVEAMWPGFEEAFHEFDLGACAMLHDEDFERLVSDTRIVRYGAKIKSVQQNALFFTDLKDEHGSVGKAINSWTSNNYIDLLETLKKKGSRLGGTTGQYFLRFMGVDSFILSTDVVARLIAEGVIDKAPTSKKALQQVQTAFNAWKEESGKSLTQISRVLAMSV